MKMKSEIRIARNPKEGRNPKAQSAMNGDAAGFCPREPTVRVRSCRGWGRGDESAPLAEKSEPTHVRCYGVLKGPRGIRISDFGFPSSFGFRFSVFTAILATVFLLVPAAQAQRL